MTNAKDAKDAKDAKLRIRRVFGAFAPRVSDSLTLVASEPKTLPISAWRPWRSWR